MSGIVDSITELPTFAKVLLVVGIAFFLLIPLTVVSAAVIGTFVLGIGDDVEATGPTVDFSGSYAAAAGEYTVTHAGGESFAAKQVELHVNGDQAYAWDGSGTVTSGDQTTLPDVSRGDTIEILWYAPDDVDPIIIGELTVS